MKIYPMMLLASITVLTGCEKENSIPVPLYNPLSGVYIGEVTYVGLDGSGNVDPEYPTEKHTIKFEIEGVNFNRPECGCAGAIAVNETEATVQFTSSEKGCEDAGSLNGQSWFFSNDIIGKFDFTMHDDTLHLSGIPDSTKNPANLQKSIVAIRQKP
ncbi:hypothetical protein [Dyadobacter sandarakinus]|uniref:Lipocalin-like domain-containing protein n=1 Tax=Dyadobacter sandarakinus TaxID=2747268 RepID=A0ABX7I6F2_9BACT|nr:hypothetical protein [Dyadobacter sandarakinus]QRR01470.1 hypothetical protein HWI92_11425 [Dyadobacter sandarakinus]